MNSLLAALFASAFVFIQCYISGTRLAFSLPAYLLIALAAVLSGFAAPKNCVGKTSRICLLATAALFFYLLLRGAFSPVEYLARSDQYMILGCLAVYGLTLRHFARVEIRIAILVVMFCLAIAETMCVCFGFPFSRIALYVSTIDCPEASIGSHNMRILLSNDGLEMYSNLISKLPSL